MKTLQLITLVMVTLSSCSPKHTEVSEVIITLEKAALERWNRGDIDGYLDLYAEDIVYFDPMLDKRMDGLAKLIAYYEPMRWGINVTECEMINPKVQAVDNMAVLTFNLKSVVQNTISSWNCTEVYRKNGNKWEIIQSHWSYVKPNLN